MCIIIMWQLYYLYLFFSLLSLSVFFLFSVVLLSIHFFYVFSDSLILSRCDSSPTFCTSLRVLLLGTLLSFSWFIAVFWSVILVSILSSDRGIITACGICWQAKTMGAMEHYIIISLLHPTGSSLAIGIICSIRGCFKLNRMNQ